MNMDNKQFSPFLYKDNRGGVTLTVIAIILCVIVLLIPVGRKYYFMEKKRECDMLHEEMVHDLDFVKAGDAGLGDISKEMEEVLLERNGREIGPMQFTGLCPLGGVYTFDPYLERFICSTHGLDGTNHEEALKDLVENEKIIEYMHHLQLGASIDSTEPKEISSRVVAIEEMIKLHKGDWESGHWKICKIGFGDYQAYWTDINFDHVENGDTIFVKMYDSLSKEITTGITTVGFKEMVGEDKESYIYPVILPGVESGQATAQAN